MSKFDKLNQYLSNLAVMNIKLHNLHWNVKGMEFMAIHNYTESLYNDFFEKYDDVAERIKIEGRQPIATMKTYLELATVEESDQTSFTPSEVVEILIKDLSQFRDEAVAIRNLADSEGDFTTVAMFEDHIEGFDKQLWFLSSMKTK